MNDNSVPHVPRDLATTLQRLYDGEIHCTITWLWDGGIEFALLLLMETPDASRDEWRHVQTVWELADAIHALAIQKYPTSVYALESTLNKPNP